jgi:plasmid stability protein
MISMLSKNWNDIKMAAVTVRNLPDAVHRALKVRAAKHGQSTEAEIREILESAVQSPARVKLGSALAAIGQEFSGIDLEIERDKTPSPVVGFE